MTVRALFSLAAVVADRAHFSGAHSGRRGQRHPYRHGGTAPGSVELVDSRGDFPAFLERIAKPHELLGASVLPRRRF